MDKSTSKYVIPRQVTLTLRDDDARATQANTPLTSLSLTFEKGVSVFTLPKIDTLDSETTEMLSSQLGNIAELQEIHTVLSRRSANHPSQFGLTAKPLASGHVGMTPISAADSTGGSRRYSSWSRSNFYSPALDFENLPTELHDEAHGWFAPNADVTAFGTMYLVPTGILGEPSFRNREEMEEFGWALAQVGIEGLVEHALWDNELAVKALVEKVLTADAEVITTMRALSDSTGVADGLKRHEYRQSLREARDVFPDITVRPRLVPQIISEELRNHSLEEYTTWSREEGKVYGLVTLDDYAVFGWRNQPKPVAAGYALTLKEPASEQAFTQFADAVQTRLTARKLGTVAVLPGDYTRLWVTRSVPLLSRFGNLFNATKDAPFQAFHEWLEAKTGEKA